ncbi:hypothetical protein [Natrialba aegyptia]|uniref:Uncharacterized protein n=1 Tax=Natrialba aegyptia DSM 13077 TaxID=1227491 RepID=M0B4D5_9EURY|nr:hypothetical protein [Natrialba aegyptia]ELZ05776.1 hypothetical protein C480_10275 [Natrialba aegyptia DSM 13077]
MSAESDVEQFYDDREAEYRDLNARHHAEDPSKFIVDCPGCGSPMVLGQFWKGCSVPACPDCNDTADTWAFEPRVSEREADIVAADETDVSELVRS